MAANTTLFKGPMELIGRIGSHQRLGEKCDEDKHIEGWLVGLGVGNLAPYTVRAVVIARLHENLPTGTALDTSQARITGTIVKAP